MFSGSVNEQGSRPSGRYNSVHEGNLSGDFDPELTDGP